MSNLEVAKLVVKAFYNYADCGIYNCRNTMGDEIKTIYAGKGLLIDICFYYSYFEVFGLTYTEFKELEKYYYSLKESEE